MGHVELNILDKTILFLLSPIIIPLVGGFFGAMYLKEAVTDLLTASASDKNINVNNNKNKQSMNSKLYKCLILGGDTAGFTTTLADPNISQYLSPRNNTFLHIAAACHEHHVQEALALTILKNNPLLMFKQNDDGDSPVHVAAKEGKWGLVKAFLEAEKGIRRGNSNGPGCSTSTSSSDDSIISSEIVDKGELAREITENGYPFLYDMVNNEGNTALHEALIHGKTELAKLLIEMDDGVLKFFELVNNEHKSAMYLAAEGGYLELVKIIKEKAGDGFNHIVCRGKSPMHAAVLRMSREILEILTSMKLNIINPKDDKGKTSLHYATSTRYLVGVRFLLSKNTMDAYQPDENGVFPIHTAASKGSVSIIEEFIQCCPDTVELLNKHGQNILHIAAKCGRDNIVKYALKNRSLRKLINLKDNNGDTPLHLATKYRHPSVVSTLTWDKRTSLKLVNNEGFTMLDIAEGNMDSIASFHGRLTWIALKSAGAQRAQNLHVLLRKKDQQVLSQISWPSIKVPNLDQIMLGLQLNAGAKLPSFESFKDRVNTLLLVTTLVATVTFAAGFTLPGGYNNSDPNQGMATMLAERSLQVFVVCDTIAMYCSIIVAVTLIWAQLGDLNLVLSALQLALPMLGIALTMMSVAFTAGVYVVVSNLHWLAEVVLVMGGMFEAIVLALFIPLFFPSQSNNIVVRYITYYPFRLVALASGNYNKQLEE